MKRILIIGSNGAGKSTFSYALAEKKNLPLVHLDQIYWHDNWQVTPHEEFQKEVLAEAQKAEWIIEGNNLRTLNQRLPYADTLFWFEFPPAVCIANILKREWKYRGKARPDMPEGCISRVDFEFLKYAWSFNKKNRMRIKEMLEQTPDLQVIRFTNRRQVKKYLSTLY